MHPFVNPGLIGGSPSIINAVDFDGTNDYLSKSADLTGNSDSKTGIFSCWFRLDGGDGTAMQFIANTSNWFRITRLATDLILVQTSGGSGVFTFGTGNTYTAGATWRHLLAAWDTNFTAGNKIGLIYVSDASDYATVSDGDAAFDIDYTQTGWRVGSRVTNDQKFNGCLAEVWFAPGQYLDISVEANRRKFISAAGKPESLGGDGRLPTGTAPLVYLKNAAATCNVNSGSGGDFTIVGAPTAASTSPSD